MTNRLKRRRERRPGRLSERGDTAVYVLLVGVGVALSLFVSATYLTGRAEASTALGNTARTLAEQISVICSPQSRTSGVCEYAGASGRFNEENPRLRETCEAVQQPGGPGWFCEWNNTTPGGVAAAPEHITGTLATASGGNVNVDRVHISADPDGGEITVRVSGCASERWLPLVRWCDTVTRSHHL